MLLFHFTGLTDARPGCQCPLTATWRKKILRKTKPIYNTPFVVALLLSSAGVVGGAGSVVVVDDPEGGASLEVPRAITTPFVSPLVKTVVEPPVVGFVVLVFELMVFRYI